MATKCKNMFLEEDGFCVECGQNHFTKKKATPKPSKKSFDINRYNDAIESNPVFKTARDTVNLLAEVYDVNVRVVFRNRKWSEAGPPKGSKWVGRTLHTPDNGEFEIIFGYECLEFFAKYGYEDYKSVDWIVPKTPRPEGAEAGKWVAMHEFAHILQLKRDTFVHKKHHDATFMAPYKEVIDLVM